MGLFSGGKKPRLRQAGELEQELVSQAEGIASNPTNIAARHADNLAVNEALVGRDADRLRARGRANADVTQATTPQPTRGGDVVANALNRGRGLARVGFATANEVDTGLLRDRASLMRRNVGRAGVGLRGLESASSLQDFKAGSNLALKDFRNELRQEGIGNFVGGAIGLIDPVQTVFQRRSELGEAGQRLLNSSNPSGLSGLGSRRRAITNTLEPIDTSTLPGMRGLL